MTELVPQLNIGPNCSGCEQADQEKCIGFAALEQIRNLNDTSESLEPDSGSAIYAQDVLARMLGESVAQGRDTFGQAQDLDAVNKGLLICKGPVKKRELTFRDVSDSFSGNDKLNVGFQKAAKRLYTAARKIRLAASPVFEPLSSSAAIDQEIEEITSI